MSDEKEESFYKVYNYGDRLQPGKELKIEHSISSNHSGTRVALFTTMSVEKLSALREESAAKEQAIFEKLCGATGEWEEQAAQTMLLDDAIEYLKTPLVKHTSNQWEAGAYHWCECSNMVYKMSYRVEPETKYNHTTKQQETVAWVVSWDLYYNFPKFDSYNSSIKIAGQDRKKFSSKEKADNYVIGRIAAFADHFQELSPPVPENLAWKFSRNGLLLPGYRVQGQEPPAQAKESEAPALTDYSRFTRKKAPTAGQKNKSSFAR